MMADHAAQQAPAQSPPKFQTKPVMLVIAGGVSGVLLSRGGDVIDSLESQDISTVNAGNCTTIQLSGNAGTLNSATAPTECSWTGTYVTAANCNGIGGTTTGTLGTANGKCAVTF